jgi:hypothetical protein
MRFWDAAKWTCRKTVREHKKAITDIQVDSEGVMLVSAAGREINFWNIANLKSLYHYKFDFGTFQHKQTSRKSSWGRASTASSSSGIPPSAR